MRRLVSYMGNRNRHKNNLDTSRDLPFSATEVRIPASTGLRKVLSMMLTEPITVRKVVLKLEMVNKSCASRDNQVDRNRQVGERWQILISP